MSSHPTAAQSVPVVPPAPTAVVLSAAVTMAAPAWTIRDRGSGRTKEKQTTRDKKKENQQQSSKSSGNRSAEKTVGDRPEDKYCPTAQQSTGSSR